MIDEKRVLPLIAEALGYDVKDLTIDSSSADIPEWDSLGHLTILSELDSGLGDDYFESEELAGATSVKEIIEALNKKN